MSLLSCLCLNIVPGPKSSVTGFVPYGQAKRDGSHDHRFNRGGDRTPAQKHGDAKRTK